MRVGAELPVHDYNFDRECHVSPVLDETAETVAWTDQLYAANRAAYLRETYRALSYNRQGLPLAHWHQPGDSTTDIGLMMGHFATPIHPRHTAEEMIALVENGPLDPLSKQVEPNEAGYLFAGRLAYDALRRAGITDKSGRPLSLLQLSAPSIDHSSDLSMRELIQVAKGDFKPFAARALATVRELKYRRIYAFGKSLGTIAGKVVETAHDTDVEVLAGCYFGDAPNFKKRWRWPLPLGIIKDYTIDSKFMPYTGDWRTADGPEPRIDIARYGERFDAKANWFGNGNSIANLATLYGLSVDGFSSTLSFMNKHNIPTSISWSESWLMRDFRQYINRDPSAQALFDKGMLDLYVARNAPHLSGENAVFQADVITRSLMFAQSVNSSVK